MAFGRSYQNVFDEFNKNDPVPATGTFTVNQISGAKA
jgi:hypothetical protein